MSKKKKSFDELLEDALLTEEEQPYVIPNNWVWSKAGNIGKNIRGVSYKKQDIEPNKNVNNVLIIRGGNIQDGRIVNQNDNVYIPEVLVKDEQKLQKGDVVIVSSTGSSKVIGKAASVPEEFVGESFGAFLTTIRPNEQINSDYFGQFYQTNNYRKLISSLAKGSNINNIKKEHLVNIPFPLPPLNEQKRIAEKLERLLGKIEEAKQLIEEAKETVRLQKMTLLDNAFHGELTKYWRKINNTDSEGQQNKHFEEGLNPLPIGWKWTRLNDVCDKITDGTHHSPKSYSSGHFMYITAKNIKENGVVLDNVTYVSKEVHDEIYARCDVKENDVLYIKDGATTGIATVNYFKEEFSLLSSVGLLRPKKDILLPEYLSFCLNSPSTKRRMLGMMSGNAIRRLTLKKIKDGLIPLPPIDEQREIVSILTKIRTLNGKLESCIKLSDNIKTLKSSILSKAFRGELGTNNQNEESAIELLKKVIQEK